MLIRTSKKIPILSVFTITFNEEFLIEFFIKHWRNRFKNCRIIVFDNESTDKTCQIAEYYNCQVIPFSTNNQLSNHYLTHIKNNCWKQIESKFVAIQDVDELTDITLSDLTNADWSIIRTNGYNMVQLENESLENINHGCFSELYCKTTIFDKFKIKEINYCPGAHKINPKGDIKYSDKIYNLYHYTPISESYLSNRWGIYAKRRSEQDKANNWGAHYEYQNIQSLVEYTKSHSIKLF